MAFSPKEGAWHFHLRRGVAFSPKEGVVFSPKEGRGIFT